MVDRREALQRIVLGLGGAAALLAFEQAAFAAASANKVRTGKFYTAGELATVIFLSDAIIPRTDTPGALDVGVPVFLDRLHADWASVRIKALHRAQLRSISAFLMPPGMTPPGLAGRSAQTQAGMLANLKRLDAEAFGDGDKSRPEIAAYVAVKALIADVYYVSEAGATQELRYDPVPGQWIAGASMAEIGRTWR